MPEKKPAETNNTELSYIQKVWHTVGIIALLVIVILIARVAFNVLLMVLAGAMIAVYFHGLADMIQRKTRMKRRWAMAISIFGSFAMLVTLLWFMGTKIQVQIQQLSNSLPITIANAKAKLAETPIGNKILDYVSNDDTSKKLMSTASHFFSTSFGVLGNLYVILLLSSFFTANPDMYKNGIILLVPKSKKELSSCVIDRISLALKGWLKSTMLSIVLITVILTVGLSLFGIPVALVLALIAGLLKIVPNFGSFLAMIPGVLLAFTISTNTGIAVTLLYIVSQTVVSSIITPIVQNRMINLPPALTIIAQVIMGTLSGGLGIILAVPLLSIVMILVDELYVKPLERA